LGKLEGSTAHLLARRSFIGGSAAALAAGLCASLPLPLDAEPDAPNLNVLGPRPGYSPQIGTFISQLTWMREANGVLSATKGLTQAISITSSTRTQIPSAL
jgi:hypothetical protein